MTAQHQKQLRLQEARRLLLSEGFDAASASYHVGYSNAAHAQYQAIVGNRNRRRR